MPSKSHYKDIYESSSTNRKGKGRQDPQETTRHHGTSYTRHSDEDIFFYEDEDSDSAPYRSQEHLQFTLPESSSSRYPRRTDSYLPPLAPYASSSGAHGFSTTQLSHSRRSDRHKAQSQVFLPPVSSQYGNHSSITRTPQNIRPPQAQTSYFDNHSSTHIHNPHHSDPYSSHHRESHATPQPRPRLPRTPSLANRLSLPANPYGSGYDRTSRAPPLATQSQVWEPAPPLLSPAQVTHAHEYFDPPVHALPGPTPLRIDRSNRVRAGPQQSRPQNQNTYFQTPRPRGRP